MPKHAWEESLFLSAVCAGIRFDASCGISGTAFSMGFGYLSNDDFVFWRSRLSRSALSGSNEGQ
jgi:hypothetical protein